MIIKQKFTTKHPTYKTPRIIKPTGIMIHSVGCAQDDPNVFYNNFNKSDYRASVHAFVSAKPDDVDVIQTLPWNYRAWHCGGDGNNYLIGIELCESDKMVYTSGNSHYITDDARFREDITRSTERAIWLSAELCLMYGLTPDNITTHKQGYIDGIASNHGDPDHVWQHIGMTLAKFREEVTKAMTTLVTYDTVNSIPDWGKNAVIWAINKGILTGNSGNKDNNGYPTNLNLTHDLLRMIVMLHRLEG